MAPNLSLFVLLAVVLVLPSAGNAAANAGSNAFNITEILDGYPEFKLFNLLLSKTRVAGEINSRSSVTLLVTDNAAVDWLLRHSARLPHAAVKELISVHVVLDYIDSPKLAALPRGGPTQVTTLFQATGIARNRTGFLNITATLRGGAVFVSAAPGSLVAARFKRAVTAKPYNVSVLEISNLIVPRGFVTRPGSFSPPAPRMRQMAIAPSPAPTPTPTRLLPTAPSMEDETEEAPAPAPSHGHAVQATSWRSAAAAAVGMACMLWFL